MTNEEAIKYNEYLLEHMKVIEKKSRCKFLNENYTALKRGIDALKIMDKLQGDLISKRDAQMKIAKVVWHEGDTWNDVHDRCVDCLDGLTTYPP